MNPKALMTLAAFLLVLPMVSAQVSDVRWNIVHPWDLFSTILAPSGYTYSVSPGSSLLFTPYCQTQYTDTDGTIYDISRCFFSVGLYSTADGQCTTTPGNTLHCIISCAASSPWACTARAQLDGTAHIASTPPASNPPATPSATTPPSQPTQTTGNTILPGQTSITPNVPTGYCTIGSGSSGAVIVANEQVGICQADGKTILYYACYKDSTGNLYINGANSAPFFSVLPLNPNAINCPSTCRNIRYYPYADCQGTIPAGKECALGSTLDEGCTFQGRLIKYCTGQNTWAEYTDIYDYTCTNGNPPSNSNIPNANYNNPNLGTVNGNLPTTGQAAASGCSALDIGCKIGNSITNAVGGFTDWIAKNFIYILIPVAIVITLALIL